MPKQQRLLIFISPANEEQRRLIQKMLDHAADMVEDEVKKLDHNNQISIIDGNGI